jgi:hypothetical protein
MPAPERLAQASSGLAEPLTTASAVSVLELVLWSRQYVARLSLRGLVWSGSV